MFSLALDCSTARGSVALLETHPSSLFKSIYSSEFPAGRGEGGKLFTALQAALRALPHGASLSEIVVGLGPGSYSGVRQAIAAATGLSLGTGAILSGVISPLALETNATAYHAIGDARRGTFYHTVVEHGLPLADGPTLLPDRAALDACLALHPSWPVLAVESAVDLLPPEAHPALPLAVNLLRSPPAVRRLPPLEPIYLRAVTVTLPRAK